MCGEEDVIIDMQTGDKGHFCVHLFGPITVANLEMRLDLARAPISLMTQIGKR